jgi:hypothetical protein
MEHATGTPFLGTNLRGSLTSLADAVGALAKLVLEEQRTDEKIHASQAALGAIKRKISESLVQSYITHGTNTRMPEDLMSQEQYYERLLLALQEMKRDIAQKIRPLELQIIEANREHLHEISHDYTRQLAASLAAVDEHIVACRQHLEEYNRIRAELQSVSEKLSELGALPPDMRTSPPARDLGEFLRSRLQYLTAQGKI